MHGLRAIRRESPGEFILALVTAVAVVGDRCRAGDPAGDRACRCSVTCVTAIVRTPWSWRRTRRDAGCRSPAAPGTETAPGLIVYRFGADLFYANHNRFVDEVRALVAKAPNPVRWLVIDASAITDIDYSAARALRGLLDELKAKGVEVIFGRVGPGLRDDLDRHRITERVGEERLFATLHEALRRAS